ncbi:THO3 [Symbiodinium natans]|uniref:THO3 protein n=1 Tax=Symbiodinium natans TaxID=878477 RepID=A0A812R3W4_9DINO|nr:THO3 [Symbiodinium natans]
MTEGANVDLEPESDDEEVVPAGKDGEAAGEAGGEPAAAAAAEPGAAKAPGDVPDEPMPQNPATEPAEPAEPLAEQPPGPPLSEPLGEPRAGMELGDSFLDGQNGNLRAELTSADALTVEDGAPVPLIVEPDALNVTQEGMEIEYDDEVLQIGELTDPWILPDYAEQDARMEKDFGIWDGEGDREEAAVPADDARQLLECSAVVEASQLQLKVLLLERGSSGRDSDALVGEVGHEGGEEWRQVRLQAADGDRWEDAEADVSLTMPDPELLAALCPAREPSADFGTVAPTWPRAIGNSLGPWPLKGPGCILFDAQRVAEVAGRLSEGSRGPVVIPGAADILDLPSTVMVQDLFTCLMGSSLPDVLGAEMAAPQLTYQELLQVCPLGGTGAVDLTRVERVTDGRVVDLFEQPFNMQYMSRRWSRGAVIKAVGKNGVADMAGIQAGDIIVTINGEGVLNATLERVEELLEAELPVRLEVAQPVLEEPLYIREASTELLTRLADDASEKAAAALLPKVSELMHGFRMNDDVPQVFAGDGGSASHVHMDLVPMVQMCHVVHGIKIFGVDATCGDDIKPWVTRFGGPAADAEVALHVDQPLEQEHAEWLSSRGVSIAICGPGDVMLFWGGNPHFGANGLGAGPCVALFHGCEPP